ncbi:HEAT repeat domain-containing protein [Seonamhaeicola maritimus]|uniref:HEAT repeat domain-containing protein n=1 Tax=Seonamhaeicola maritimus TaxID=2591822 RepID=A0A5C7GE50_9FLAO|nr:HEAT repeat domain-containing protein [Seonamhaeicola maritimus]TXG34762.1 HEAT repeat domain-containing protein [Seonamhaeicola maritimus]
MLHHIKYFLFKLNIVQPSENDIDRWIQYQYVYRIEYALEYGNYRTRKLAAEALGILGHKSSIPILLKTIDDKVQNVSIAALNALEKIGCNDELGSTVIKRRFNWLKQLREKEAIREASKGKKYNIYRWERASKKSFDRVKEQLKKPIR